MALNRTKAAAASAPSSSGSPADFAADPSLSFSSTVAGDLSSIELDWEDASPQITRRSVFALVSGLPDTGRTTLALTAPGPIAYINTGEKAEGVVEDAVARGTKVRKIFVGQSYRGSSLGEVQEMAERMSRKAEAAIADAFTWAKSIVIDNKDQLYTTIELARLGTQINAERSDKDKKLGRLVSAAIKARFRAMTVQLYRELAAERERRGGTQVNLIMVGLMKEEYKGNESTGRVVDTNLNSLYDVDLVLHTKVDRVDNTDKYSARIHKPWMNGIYRGKSVEGEMLDIVEVCAMLTGTDPEEWRK